MRFGSYVIKPDSYKWIPSFDGAVCGARQIVRNLTKEVVFCTTELLQNIADQSRSGCTPTRQHKQHLMPGRKQQPIVTRLLSGSLPLEETLSNLLH